MLLWGDGVVVLSSSGAHQEQGDDTSPKIKRKRFRQKPVLKVNMAEDGNLADTK